MPEYQVVDGALIVNPKRRSRARCRLNSVSTCRWLVVRKITQPFFLNRVQVNGTMCYCWRCRKASALESS